MNVFQSIKLAWLQYRTFRSTLTELQGCSDRQLADMGFAHGDLTRVAYEAAERHVAKYQAQRPVRASSLATDGYAAA